jgi:glycosyltransferase involved in cell wall biosynthesis
MNKLVSIVIAAYNAEKYISEAIDSCLVQTYPHIEIVIVNDGSQDTTLSILEQYAHQNANIKILNQTNQGVGAARNAGNQLAQGEWIAVLDADDIMFPTRIEEQMSFVQANPQLSMLGSWAVKIGANHELLGYFSIPDKLFNVLDYQEFIKKDTSFIILHSTVIYRKEDVLNIGGYRNYQFGEDIDLFNRLAEANLLILVIPKPLIKYRIHESSLMNTNHKRSYYVSHWLVYNKKQRREQEKEISFEEFEGVIRQAPLPQKIRFFSSLYAKSFSRKATYYLGKKNYPLAFLCLFFAFLANPWIVVEKIWRQIKSFKVFSNLSRR